ncbi:unnamed protein product [Hermetia illucens]|uniref:Uncharacterized protein n=1 Tax=Hermetia illucens TaxID=343691 RepID=A0A7R8Z017_HERIL|nr:unnamed protein product [Hermetia illucens]
MGSSVATQATTANEISAYSTPTPVVPVWSIDNSTGHFSESKSATISSSRQYSVTEHLSESDLHSQSIFSGQSAFHPETENNATFLNILHRGHDVEIHNETDETVPTKEEGQE